MKRTRNAVETYVGAGSIVRGGIEAVGSVRIDGTVHGSIQTAGSVILGPKAKVYGDIVAGSASVGGFVQGGVYVLGILEVEKDGRVRGDVFAARLEAAEGAVFHGRLGVTGSGAESLSARASFMGRTAGDTAQAGMKTQTNPFPGES